ncbi:arginine repressor [Clostridiaceae bacterium HSG29]|nr:arginine repressor [Clostridiaceae bacterium HSG29]
MKYSRHSKIIEIIKEYEVETQQELAKLLKKKGCNVTQATVSRDIKELRLVKILSTNGNYKYSKSSDSSQLVSERFMKMFRNAVLDVDYTHYFVVFHTLEGSANAAAAAVDALANEKIVGTIAGDDTIFLLARTENDAIELMDYFRGLLE